MKQTFVSRFIFLFLIYVIVVQLCVIFVSLISLLNIIYFKYPVLIFILTATSHQIM